MKCDTGRPARGMTDAAGGASAGLRVILRLRKQEPELAIVNVSPEVYEIFEMTGFTEMMPVSRAYRRVSVDGCEVIGQGANGKVYRLDPETIIKVYLNPTAFRISTGSGSWPERPSSWESPRPSPTTW